MAIIEEFLENFPSKSTKRAYRSHLKKYFEIIKADPKSYFNSNRDYEKDIKIFWQNEVDNPPLTRLARMSCLRSFLSENDVEIKSKVWNTLKKRAKGSRPVTLDIVPTNHELKKILIHGETKARALFLIASSSGMRIDEILQLKLSDIVMDNIPVKINVRGETTKTGNPRITFMSNEAKDALEEWLKERDEWLQIAIKKVKHLCRKSLDDDTIFPFKYEVARLMWVRLTNKAGFTEKDERTGRYKMHIHTLRKFFETRMSLEIPKDAQEELSGHEGYLSQAYRRIPERELAKLYQKGVHTLTIFETAGDVSDIREQLKEKDMRIKELEQQIKDINDRLDKGVATYLFEEMQKLKHTKK